MGKLEKSKEMEAGEPMTGCCLFVVSLPIFLFMTLGMLGGIMGGELPIELVTGWVLMGAMTFALWNNSMKGKQE